MSIYIYILNDKIIYIIHVCYSYVNIKICMYRIVLKKKII